MQRAKATIVNKRGLHARASAKLAGLAGEYQSDIRLHTPNRDADAKSIMELMMLAASVGSEVCLEVQGEDEQVAMDALLQLIASGFDEND